MNGELFFTPIQQMSSYGIQQALLRLKPATRFTHSERTGREVTIMSFVRYYNLSIKCLNALRASVRDRQKPELMEPTIHQTKSLLEQ